MYARQLIVLILLALGMVSYSLAHQRFPDQVLLIGLELKDLQDKDSWELQQYRVIERKSMSLKKINSLRQELRAKYTLVLTETGQVYKYNSAGALENILDRKCLNCDEHYGNRSLSANLPFPGDNVPDYVFPGTSQFSYLFGEGRNPPKRVYSNARRTLKEFSGTHQNNNIYPFWRENYLQADRLPSDYSSLSSSNDFRTSSDTVRDIVSIGTQWGSYSLGVGATFLDALIDKRELDNKRAWERHYRHGTPEYVYPNRAETYTQPVPSQPYVQWH